MRRLEASIVRTEMESPEILRCHTQQAHEDYPSQPCGISHFSQIILWTMNWELLTFKILTWAYLELHLNWVESWALNPGRGSKERTLAQHLPGQVMCALEACHHTSSAGCLQHYHIAPLPATLGGYYYRGHCVVSELISVSDGPAVTSQHATGSHLSHCRNDLNWRKKHTLLRIWTENSKTPLNLLLESKYFWYISMFWAD